MKAKFKAKSNNTLQSHPARMCKLDVDLIWGS